MSLAKIVTGPVEDGLWRMVEDIFFLSATHRFDSEQERQAFLERWTGYYRECEPQRIYLALLSAGKVAGYLMGCRDSRLAKRLYRDIPYYSLFEDQFGEFPAHLHINIHPQWRGHGFGSRLVHAFVEDCDAAHIAGVHVVTAPELPNVEFYRSCGFTVAVQRNWRQRKLLFLGKPLCHS